MICRQCSAVLDCPNCSISLTVHRQGDKYRGRCHYCNFSKLVPNTCEKCAAPYLERIGFGTERVEAEVRKAFPSARIARVDRDTVRRKGSLVEVLAKVANREVDILIGTQMIAKGHDFPDVTLVGVISADVGLGMADFRSAERTFQLLTQVAGRAGRGERPGEAIIQSLIPNHYSIKLACAQDYPAFYDEGSRVPAGDALSAASGPGEHRGAGPHLRRGDGRRARSRRRRPRREGLCDPRSRAGAADQAARRAPRAIFPEGDQPKGDARGVTARRVAPARGSPSGSRSTSIRSRCSDGVAMNSPIGAGVKQTIKIASAPAASICRPRPIGRSSSSVGGWCGPTRKIIPIISAVQMIHPDETNVRPIARAIVMNVISVERRPNTA